MHDTRHNLTTPVRALGGLLVIAALAVAIAGCGDKSGDPLAKAQREARRNPKSAEAQVALAEEYAKADMHNDAYIAYRKAIGLDPSNADAHLGMASTDLELNNAAHAIASGSEVLKTQPDNATALDLVGRGHILRQEPDKAIAAFRKALKADPNHLDAGVDLVYALIQKGDTDAALDAAKSVADRHPKSARAHYTYGDVLLLSRRGKEAEPQFRAALKLDPNHAGAMVRLSRVLLEARRGYEEVRKLALKAAELEPGDGLPAAMAAVASFKLGEIPDALSEMDMVCRSNPYNPVTWALFADLLAASGHPEESKLARIEALKVAPRLPLTDAQRKLVRDKTENARKEGKDPYVQVDVREILGEDSAALRDKRETTEAAAEAASRQR